MFTDIAQALAIAKSKLSVTDTSKDTELTAILNTAIAKDVTGKPYYRPYVAAAYYLLGVQTELRQGLKTADGATWLTPEEMLPVIQTLLTLQEAADAGLMVAPGWTAHALRMRLFNQPPGILGAFVI